MTETQTIVGYVLVCLMLVGIFFQTKEVTVTFPFFKKVWNFPATYVVKLVELIVSLASVMIISWLFIHGGEALKEIGEAFWWLGEGMLNAILSIMKGLWWVLTWVVDQIK